MKKPGPYLVLLETEGQYPSAFEFESLYHLREWSKVKDDEPPSKFNAKFLGTVFRPSELTPEILDGLQQFEDLFAELEELRERKRRANTRRQAYYKHKKR